MTAALSVFLQSRMCDARIVNMRDFYGFTPFLVAVNAERLGNFGLSSSYAYIPVYSMLPDAGGYQ